MGDSNKAAALAALVTAVGCGGAEIPVGPTDAGVRPDPIGAPFSLIVEPQTDTPPYWAAALDRGDLLAAYADRVERIGTSSVAQLAAPEGRIVGLGAYDEGALVAASDGFYVLDGHQLVRSPLSDALSDMEPAALLSVPRVDRRELWIAGTTGLAVWSRGRLRRMTPGSLPVQGCALAHGAPISGRPAVWAACTGQVYALLGTDDAYQAHPLPVGSDVLDIAVDGSGTLWLVDAMGGVHSRDGSGAVRAHDFTAAARHVAAAGPDVWFETDEGVWHFDQTRFAPVEGVAGARIDAAEPGQVILTTDAGLARAYRSRVVVLDGLLQGGLLEELTLVTAHPVPRGEVASVTATLDGAPIAVDEGWAITLDPEALEDGTHDLTVVAAFEDGESVQSTLRFSRFAGPPPTWSADVRPLFETRCALCHGAQGSARRLDTVDLWKDQIDKILDNLRNGRMPLPPTPLLDAEELGQVEGWAAAGYPEGE